METDPGAGSGRIDQDSVPRSLMHATLSTARSLPDRLRRRERLNVFTIRSDELSVSVLDPLTDQSLLGSRYCTGGYIWQITDRLMGRPLLSGPAYPGTSPPPFDGQGAPEAFVTPLGEKDPPVGGTVTMIGVGTVLRLSEKTPFHPRENPTVIRFCEWEISAGNRSVCMSTRQTGPGHAVSLSRRIEVEDRTVTSATEITNRSGMELTLRWFPHPFFPLDPSNRCLRLPFRFSVPENPGFFRDSQGNVSMKQGFDWTRGCFLPLDIAADTAFDAEVYHPLIHPVRITCSYILESLPLWANAATFSPEPYLCLKLAHGETGSWNIEYRFGP